MDYCTTTNKVKLTSAEVRKLNEANALLTHIGRLAGAEVADGVGDLANETAGGIVNVLVRVETPKVKASDPPSETPAKPTAK